MLLEVWLNADNQFIQLYVILVSKNNNDNGI